MSSYLIFSGRKGDVSIDLASFRRNTELYQYFSEASILGNGDEAELTGGVIAEVMDDVYEDAEKKREEVENFERVPNRDEEMVRLIIALKRDLKDIQRVCHYLDFLSAMVAEIGYGDYGFDKLTYRVG